MMIRAARRPAARWKHKLRYVRWIARHPVQWYTWWMIWRKR